MKRRLIMWIVAMLFMAAGLAAAPRAQNATISTTPKPNYDLAWEWTAQKVGRLVFDTSVTPRWLETSDRFWYSYQTREGRQVLSGRSVEEEQGAAVRPRQDGGRAHRDHA
jgi:hypothetical protein